MLVDEREQLATILRTTAETLDIPDHVFEDATLKYEDVCEHLGADDSALNQYNPQLYVQGSFRLGTVVQPINKNDEYDIDLVCLLEIAKEAITQEDLKTNIGQRLKSRDDLAKITKESRRCWVLDFPKEPGMPGFHMDVLPSIPNQDCLPTGLLLTDTELTRWQKSNPIGYAEWFKTRMDFITKKAVFAASRQASVEEIQDWQVKTSLQRSVQLLKRHRDIYFQHNAEVKPSSIILTTLAAHAYESEEDEFEALAGITKRMPLFIKYENQKWSVTNPVDDGENFADKWNEYPERREAFLLWLRKVKSDFDELLKAGSLDDGLIILEKSLGRQTMYEVASRLGINRLGHSRSIVSPLAAVPVVGDGRHVEKPPWPVVEKFRVKVGADVYSKRVGKSDYGRSARDRCPKRSGFALQLIPIPLRHTQLNGRS